MKISFSWLKKFLITDLNLNDIVSILTNIGLEVDGVCDRSIELNGCVVGRIANVIRHPNADNLKLCEVDIGTDLLQIVCGASNVTTSMKVVVATIGTIIPSNNLKIKKSTIRGVESFGMLCSSDELLLNFATDGIVKLDDDAVVGESFSKYFGLDDPVIDINVTPNRADALSVYGIARDLAAAGAGQLRDVEILRINDSFKTSVSVSISDYDLCSQFALREIRNVDNLVETPKWMKKLLDLVGISSVSPLVDILNYVTHSFGQPMHVYDRDFISDKIDVKLVKKSVNFCALNSNNYILEEGDLVVGSDQEEYSIAGIIGSLSSACTSRTKNILIEAANFSKNLISRTSRRLLIETSSRYRFERGIDKDLAIFAINYATNIISEICGGFVSFLKLEGSCTEHKRSLLFPIKFLKLYTGVDLLGGEICAILSKLGFVCTLDSAQNNIKIDIPSWRSDIERKEDIVEEILRIYGYDKIQVEPLPDFKIVEESACKIEKKDFAILRRLVADSGYTELVTWSFLSVENAKYFSIIDDRMKLLNPISNNLAYMRPSLFPNLLQAIHFNLNRSLKNLSFFEMGEVFSICSGGVKEECNIVGVRTGNNMPANIHFKDKLFDVFDIKSDLSKIFNFLGFDIEKLTIDNTNLPKYYHPTRSGKLLLRKNVVGYLGQINPVILDKFCVEQDVFGFELFLDNISTKPKIKQNFAAISDYQPILRDYSFVISKEYKIGEIINFIEKLDQKLIKSVVLFDIYSGKNISDDKQSISVSVTIQNDLHTLTSDEIEKIDSLIVNTMNDKYQAILRAE